ncbi:hypothetical protein AALP_AA8G277700 [Arabis alpina]|uniref:Uncharacterized protein n=1 Tax=Arabis alpina TaxID=50452 RepID=A0A087G9W8_ARAAL|nr:hypothetical protein AALP_AA8G277700 [Arabis alpina]
MSGKGKAISLDEIVDGEESLYENESDDGDWHNFALMDCKSIENGDKKRKGKEIAGAVIREGGECSHKWPGTLDLIDLGDDADSEDAMARVKVRPCVLQPCADEALNYVLANLVVTPRDAPPVLGESVNAG